MQAGDTAPDFSLPASLAGRPFDYALKDALRAGAVVIYFYPSAFTSGCNTQAHGFARDLDQFTAAGASVIGISLDSIERLNAFSADPQYCAGKIPVASDAHGQVARAFGLPVEAMPPGKTDTRGEPIDHDKVPRTTFVVGADGKVAATLAGLSAAEHVEHALAWVQHLSAERAARPSSGR
nr:peroxiredoxin [Burkholderia alba]